jgi:phenylacetate-coenzyme A ligase PaaK-like adenylate-forming protein
MTFRGGASMDVGLYRTKRFAATDPMPRLIAELEAYQPDFILGYPSILALLAQEQELGHLRIAPRGIITSSEVCTEAMSAAIQHAWGSAPLNCLGLTETGITAMSCEAHTGLHVFEDLCIVEAVGAHNRPVPARTPGAKILVTNLYNRVQPIIRFEVTDLVTLDDAACACGRTLQRIIALDGRSDDILELPGKQGKVVLHPLRLRSILGAEPAVLQYQITYAGHSLEVQVVLATGASPEKTAQLRAALEETLRSAGTDLPVVVRATAAIDREPGPGKLKLVRVAAGST